MSNTFIKQDRSIEYVWSWFEDQKDALKNFRNKIYDSLINQNQTKKSKFFGFTIDEFNSYFDESSNELEHLVCFDLISSTEAILRLDFIQKVNVKDKSEIGRIFRKIEKQKRKNKKKNRISLEEDIIENWKNEKLNKKSVFSDFVGLLKYRHWLAHGKYWSPKLSKRFTPGDTYDITEKIIETIKN